MKQFILVVFLILADIALYAQEGLFIKETFEDKVYLDWQEYSTKNGSAMVKYGYLELICKEKEQARRVFVDLPLEIEKDFTITAVLKVPEINDTDYFGLEFDYSDDFEQVGFLLKEETFALSIGTVIVQEIPVKLSKGRNQKVNLKLERSGDNYIFEMNNMEVWKFKRKVNYPKLCFYTSNVSTLQIEEVTIEQ
ncbi:hypothetical protein [Phocaeicola sartorii]|uniref:hypothetical protein n=1 Tax=Phocaeicola sartorii TaxID=671267 RepID=UPI002557E582|nr:hypothetical protein [Phocaeicola sartorii]